MNASATAPLPMTDLGRLLSGRDAQVNLTQLDRALDDELMRVRRRMAAGLGQEEYVHAGKRVTALQSAQLVLKSVQIYLAP